MAIDTDAIRQLVSSQSTFPSLPADGPRVLYGVGDFELLEQPTVAIVGSRSIDADGARLARTISADLARAGAIVVSGGAIGTDTIAHTAALEAGAPTVCVLPCGVDVAAPARNRTLFQQISEDGLLLSAYPRQTKVRKHHYHDRNALLVAISDVVIVVRAGARSGSRISGNQALAQNKPLFVVPGAPDDPTASGCLDLLEDPRSKMFRSIEPIVELLELRAGSFGTRDGDTTAHPHPIAAALLALGGRATCDAIADELGWDVLRVTAELIELELLGICRRDAGGAEVSLARS